MSGHLAENIVYFGRALRKAGLPLGPKSILEAVEAVDVARIGTREDLYWTLHSVMVKRRDHSMVFDQAFRIFWRRRALIEKMMQQFMRSVPADPSTKGEEANRRVAEALLENELQNTTREEPQTEIDIDARMTLSNAEVLRSRDFEQMSAAEIDEAKHQIAQLVLPVNAVVTRRFGPARRGSSIDMRRTMRASLRAGGAGIELRMRAPSTRHPPVVALCDISGSMSTYSRIFLHFLHALSRSGRRVSSFLFATELSNITRHLRSTKDPDEALATCGRQVRDWDGGTRIAGALHQFNKRWSRRVLGQGAIVLLITDGLERDVDAGLASELDRLRRSCRRLIWLNPLLRFDGFEARAKGIRTMLPHVDEFRSIHNLNSMQDLCEALRATHLSDADPRRYLVA